eukprot:767433-Hanusia_phi.AAC.5
MPDRAKFRNLRNKNEANRQSDGTITIMKRPACRTFKISQPLPSNVAKQIASKANMSRKEIHPALPMC